VTEGTINIDRKKEHAHRGTLRRRSEPEEETSRCAVAIGARGTNRISTRRGGPSTTLSAATLDVARVKKHWSLAEMMRRWCAKVTPGPAYRVDEKVKGTRLKASDAPALIHHRGDEAAR